MTEEENDSTLELNPEKLEEVDRFIMKNISKKKISKKDEIQLWLLCKLRFDLQPDELKKAIDMISSNVKNKKNRTKAEKEIEKLVDQFVIVKKKEEKR